MNDTETTPSDPRTLVEEAYTALSAIAARCEEVAGSLRAGHARFRGLSETERTAFIRNAAAALRRVEQFAQFGAYIFEGMIGEATGPQTPRDLPAVPKRHRWSLATKLLTAIAGLAAAAAGLLHELFNGKTPPGR